MVIFLCAGCLIHFLHCMQYNFSVCHIRMKDISDLYRGLVGRCCQSQPHLWVSCALALALSLLPCPLLCTLRVLVFQGPVLEHFY